MTADIYPGPAGILKWKFKASGGSGLAKAADTPVQAKYLESSRKGT